MKATCFLISVDQKRYHLIFKKIRYGEDVDKDECTVIITSALDLLIHIEGGIHRTNNPIMKIASEEGHTTQKDVWSTYFHSIGRKEAKKIQHWYL